MNRLWAAAAVFIAFHASNAAAAEDGADISAAPLSSLVKNSSPSPWMAVEGGPETHPPAYLGLKPLEMALGVAPPPELRLPESLRALGEKQIAELSRTLPSGKIELEGWPAPDDYGLLTWAFARWRRGPGEPWLWLDSSQLSSAAVTAPLLPQTMHPWIAKEEPYIFEDFLKLPELIDQPAFVDCVWTDEQGSKASGAWLPDSQRAPYRAKTRLLLESGARRVCRVTPQPSRFNGKPVAFVIGVDAAKNGDPELVWPKTILWTKYARQESNAQANTPGVNLAWPDDFARNYRSDDLVLAGEAEAVFPVSGRKLTFARKNSSDPAHQLEDLADYLTERYRKLGLRVKRDRFAWRGIKQSNLIAVIPGSSRGKANRPVLLADHIDTAYCEDIYDAKHERVSAPGADDNATATAALLRAAEVLRNSHPKNDIWLVHLTGEEYPAGGLGSWRLLESLLKRKQEISGIVLLDMLGHRNQGDGIFQVNPGNSRESDELARLALGLAPGLVEPWMKPVLRSWGDDHSYLYNTDGIFFSDAGFPIVFLNEHLNRFENYGRPGHHRPGYHQSDDVSSGVDFTYASAMAKLAIAVTARLSQGP